MHIPTTLKHKPVLVAEDYGRIDGRTAYGSDAQGLSLGLAQWNDRGKVDISAKVWRHTGEKWSRQSEELGWLRSAFATPPWLLRARTVATSTQAEGAIPA